MTDTGSSTDHRSTADLISSAFQHVNGLVRGEISLAKAEIQESMKHMMAGIGMMAAAAIMVVTALNVFAAAIAAGLTEAGLHPGWAAFLTGIFFLVAAGILAMIGKKALDPENLMPTRTARNVRRDAETVKEATR